MKGLSFAQLGEVTSDVYSSREVEVNTQPITQPEANSYSSIISLVKHA